MILLLMMTMNSCADKENNLERISNNLSLENREASNCEAFICGLQNWVQVTDTLFIRNCPVTVTYEWRKCLAGFEIQNFNFVPFNNPNCTVILDSIATFWLGTQFTIANQMYNAWYKEITLAVQSSILPTLDEGDFNSSGTLTMQFIEIDCHTLCVDIYVDQYENISIGFIGHVKCGESCCIRVGQFRFDQNGDAFIFGQGVVDGTECEPTTVYCSGEYDEENCTPACGRL